jgi:two-component system phosphate regulon response regulator PhoB
MSVKPRILIVDDEPETLELVEFNLRQAGFDVSTAEAEAMKFGDVLIDLPRHQLSIRGKKVELTATEFKLLTVLAQRRGRVQSRDTLLRDVWDYNSLVDTRTVDTHMRCLREKLGPAAKHLDTVRGVGYRFAE